MMPHANDPVEGFLDLPKGKIHYLDWPGRNNRSAHFLHANGFCAGTYAPFLQNLNEEFRILASDVRGHGDSDPHPLARVRHWRLFARDLKHVIEHLLQPPVIGIGHSLGAVTTYIAAATWPHLFSAIVLIDPVILPPRILNLMRVMKVLGLIHLVPLARGARRRRREFESKQAALKRFTSGRGIFKSWSSEFIEAYLECGLLEADGKGVVLKCDPELEARIFESAPTDAWRYAKRIQCPALAIRGEKSDTFQDDAARRLAEIIPDCTLSVINGTGHFVPMEKPVECARLISRFVQQHGL